MGDLLTQFMNKYAYTDFHELNADWMIRTMMELINQVENFVSLNAIKYADPIQWDITRQYEKNTVVIDPITGTAYISVAPVPMGVALTNTDYWSVVFDLGSFVVNAAKNFTNRYEAETTLTATFPSSVGQWLVWGDVLYKALTNITPGDAYVVDGNIEHFTIEDLYTSCLNTIANLTNIIGDIDDLETTDKSSVVAAINEVVGNVTDILKYRAYITPEAYGAVGDGITDDTTAINAAIAAAESSGMILYFPAGKNYGITSTIHINSADVIMDSPITELGSDNSFDAIIVGVPETRLYFKKLKLWVNCENRYPMADNFTGITLHNVCDSDIEIMCVTCFTYGVKMLASNNAFVSNRIVLGLISDCKFGLTLKSIGTGFVNDNTFFKGYFGTTSLFESGVDVTNITIDSDGTYQNNNTNVFYSPSFEGRTNTTPVHIYHGRNNKFLECRNENTNSNGYFMICENTSRMNKATFAYNVSSNSSAKLLDLSTVGSNVVSLYNFEKLTSFSAPRDIEVVSTDVETKNGAFFNTRAVLPSKTIDATYIDISNGMVKGISDSSPAVVIGSYVDTSVVKQFLLNVNSTGNLAIAVVCYDENDNLITTYTPSTPEWQYTRPVKFGEGIQTPNLVASKFYAGSTFDIDSYDYYVTLAPEVKRALIGVYLKTTGAVKGLNVSSISDGLQNHIPTVLV